jgi:hypothetical protein
MTEPQATPWITGTPAEGNPVQPGASVAPGYTAGPTPNLAPSVPLGNPSVNQAVPAQRPQQRVGEWRW